MTSQERHPIPIVVVDKAGWESFGLFNPNQLRSDLKAHGLAAGAALAMVYSASRQLANARPNPSAFMHTLRNDPAFRGHNPRPDLLPVAINQDREFLGSVYNALVAVKTFLDVYARFLTRAIVPSAQVFGFNKDRNRVGGRVTKWLRGSTPTTFPHREELATIIEQHVNDWIEKAVTWRDHVVHDGRIPGLSEMHIVLDREMQLLSVDAVQQPRMPDGSAPIEYAASLWTNVQRFISESLPLLPGTRENTPHLNLAAGTK